MKLGEKYNKLKEVLENNGCALIPTETVAGLICDANSIIGVEKIYNIKSRSRDKPLAIFHHDINFMRKVAIVNDKVIAMMEVLKNSSITYILDKKPEASDFINIDGLCGNDTIGFRRPNCNEILGFLKYYNKPIYATSANISNNVDVFQIKDVDLAIKSAVDFIYEDNDYKIDKPATPSTIIKFKNIDNLSYSIVRQGILKSDEIDFAIKSIISNW
jgi:L-threonylcarbamoyladenylate synthase